MGFSVLARNGLCSLMICWLLLVPAGVPMLVSLLLSSFFPQEKGSVPSWFAGSSWFRLGFRCLSPFFSLLSFLRKGVLFHRDLLVLPGSGWGSGACLPSSLFFGSGACLPSSLFFLSPGKGFCSIMICWFFLVPAWVPVLVSLILSSLVPVLVSLLLSSFFPQDRGSVPSWFVGPSWLRLGFRCLSPFFSFLWFWCLSPFFSLLSFLRKGVLFHHDLLAHPGSGRGSGACLPPSLFFLSSGKGFCSIMICWFVFVPAWVLVLVSPSSLFFGSGACLPSSLLCLCSGKGFCSIMICWFLLVPARFPVLVSLLLSSFFPQEIFVLAGVPVLVSLLLSFFFSQENHHGFPGSSCFGLGFRCLSPFFSFFFVCQTVPWILNCTWLWWKHALLLFGVYAGVIFECFCFFCYKWKKSSHGHNQQRLIDHVMDGCWEDADFRRPVDCQCSKKR